MTNLEILRLPEIPEGTPETQLRAIRSYLYRLAEQLQYLLASEREERVRDTRNSSAETLRSLRKQLESPQMTQQLLRVNQRQLGERYVSGDNLERLLQITQPRWWSLEQRLAELEKPENTDDVPGLELCVSPRPGVSVQEGSQVYFRPFPAEESLLKAAGRGRWQIESGLPQGKERQ